MSSSYRGLRSILQNPLFDRYVLRVDERKLLEELGFTRKLFRARVDITQEGDESDHTYILDAGWSCLYKILPDGQRQILDFPLTGDVIGLRGAKGSSQRSFMAVTDVIAYEASATALVSAMARSERLAQLIINEEARHKAILIEHLTNLGRRGALARVSHLLLELGARLRAVGLAGEDGYQCPLTQYDLADALGLTAIHVNRMLRELRESNFLHFYKGYVEIMDRDHLIALAGFDPTYITR